MIPILERLLFRPKTVAVTRVLVIVHTRELATQVYEVTLGLSKFSSVGVCLCVGGMSNKQQEQELQLKPDIVIATPGRLIDHIHNSKSFTLDHIEVLVIDEADRILQQGFEKELDEIVRFLPKRRQSMLFSATMTDSIDQLIKLSLNEPIRLFVDSSTKLTSRLVQEFIKVRQVREETRPAILIALCSRTYKKECIIFFRSKKATHYMRVLFQLFGLKAAELHGDLTQPQTTENLNLFKSKKVDFLLCTDVASRGLDIPEVKTVINYDMPATYEVYIHRCGRTARGTKGGRAVGLVGENDRVVMKMALKNSSEDVKNRVIPSKIILEYEHKVESLQPDLEKKFEEEKMEKEFERVEMELKKAENRIVYAKEIESRPARVWFQTESEKGN
jgi:ATP-dependent RNA helicase DDX27